MKIKALQVGMIMTNCYLFGDESTGKGAIVDPGDDGTYVLREFQKEGWELTAILLTHGHFDHVTGVPEILAACPGVPVYITQQDYAEAVSGGGMAPGIGEIPNVRFYREGDQVEVGGLTVEVMETPGHTPGSVTLRVGDALFTGDTLFRASCGRTDFPGGSYAEMMRSLKRLGELQGDLRVYPGHEGASNLDYERAVNYFVREALHL